MTQRTPEQIQADDVEAEFKARIKSALKDNVERNRPKAIRGKSRQKLDTEEHDRVVSAVQHEANHNGIHATILRTEDARRKVNGRWIAIGQVGIPDMLLCFRCRAIFVEVKTGSASLSRAQLHFRDGVVGSAGMLYCVIRGESPHRGIVTITACRVSAAPKEFEEMALSRLLRHWGVQPVVAAWRIERVDKG